MAKPQLLIENIKRKAKGKRKSSIKVGPSNFNSTNTVVSKEELNNFNLMDSHQTNKFPPDYLNCSSHSNEESKEFNPQPPLKFNQVKIKESNLHLPDGSLYIDYMGILKPREVEMRKFKPSKINLSLERTQRLISP